MFVIHYLFYRAGAETCPYRVTLKFFVGEGLRALPLRVSVPSRKIIIKKTSHTGGFLLSNKIFIFMFFYPHKCNYADDDGKKRAYRRSSTHREQRIGIINRCVVGNRNSCQYD